MEIANTVILWGIKREYSANANKKKISVLPVDQLMKLVRLSFVCVHPSSMNRRNVKYTLFDFHLWSLGRYTDQGSKISTLSPALLSVLSLYKIFAHMFSSSGAFSSANDKLAFK